MPLVITLLLGAFFLIGIIIVKISDKHSLVEQVSVAIAAGAMGALLGFDLIPEMVESYDAESFWQPIVFAAIGFFVLKLLDTFVPEHESHDTGKEESLVHIGIMSALAITIHNVLEGMSVYSVADRDIMAGISLGLGVGLHNIPMGMLIFATLKHQHNGKKYALITLSVISTFIGGLLMFALSPYLMEEVLTAVICITTGMVIYILVMELIPSIIKNPKWLKSLVFVAIGFGIVFASTFIE